MILKVERRDVYGRALFYPLNEPAKRLAGIMRQKTFSEKDLVVLKEIGAEIYLFAQPLKEEETFLGD